ncbi:MAG: hypothetical protein DME58_08645 [Verrucomicrobia bacterium]|nr:MAG: hypothetical protein DME58_08645 [Verrucomicrobiota bacterium]
MRTGLWILVCAVSLVLLIACANLTTMLLARAASREREMAIRVALGAGLKRMLRQLLTESVVLSILGGIAGVLLAVGALDVLRVIGAQTVPRLREVDLDLSVLAMTFVVAVATGILFGLVPALVSAKPELTEALKEGGRGATEGLHRNRLRSGLIVAETALALVLLIGAGLLVKSFVQLQNVSPGFNPHNVLTAEISLPVEKYPHDLPVINFYAEAERRIKNIFGPSGDRQPGVREKVLSQWRSARETHIEGRHKSQVGDDCRNCSRHKTPRSRYASAARVLPRARAGAGS